MAKIEKVYFRLDNVPNKYMALAETSVLLGEKINELIDEVNKLTERLEGK